MSCPVCGENGRCEHFLPARVRPRFRPTGAAAHEGTGGDRELAEGESRDTSEQQFAASLEAPSSAPRFVPDMPGDRRPQPAQARRTEALAAAEPGAAVERLAGGAEADCVDGVLCGPAILPAEDDSPSLEAAEVRACLSADPAVASSGICDSDGGEEALANEPQWRQEVAARLNNYHSRRRKRPPRYPSLALKFDPPLYTPAPSRAPEPGRAVNYQAGSRAEAATAAVAAPEFVEEPGNETVDATNIIEFPRPLVPPPPRPDELAEPMLDLPRILDAPETVPKQVPLGGIILEPEQGPVTSDLELPPRVAPLDRRLLAAGVDGGLVLGATLMFALIANKIAALLPSLHVLLGLGVALPAILWAIYEYVFLVYSGTTPGMRLSGLQLSQFEGGVPDRDTRRWRALAMALSAVSLGLGFLWCLLDEDTLCWHDRITRTYLDPGPAAAPGARQGPVFPQRIFAGLRRVEAFLQRRAEETSQEPSHPPQG